MTDHIKTTTQSKPNAVLTYLQRPLFVAAFAHFALELTANFLPVLYPLFVSRLGLSFAQIGFVALIAGGAASLAQPIFGILSDRWGPILMTAISVAWSAVLMGLVGFTWNYGSLVILVGIGMLGSAAFHPPGATLASSGGSSRRGAAVSVFSVGGNLGAAFSPLLVGVAVGVTGSMAGTAILIPVGLISAFFIYRQLRPRQNGQNTAIKDEAKSKTSEEVARKVGQGSAIALALIIVATMMRSWFQVSLSTYLPIWLEDHGWSLVAAGQILSVMLFSIGIGSLLGGILSDKMGRWQVMAWSLAWLTVGHWFFLQASGFGQILLVGLMGVMIGASFPVTIVMAQEVWPRGVGLASALVIGLGWAPGGIGSWVTGLIADRFSLQIGLQTLIAVPVLGLLCMIGFVWVQRQAVSFD